MTAATVTAPCRRPVLQSMTNHHSLSSKNQPQQRKSSLSKQALPAATPRLGVQRVQLVNEGGTTTATRRFVPYDDNSAIISVQEGNTLGRTPVNHKNKATQHVECGINKVNGSCVSRKHLQIEQVTSDGSALLVSQFPNVNVTAKYLRSCEHYERLHEFDSTAVRLEQNDVIAFQTTTATQVSSNQKESKKSPEIQYLYFWVTPVLLDASPRTKKKRTSTSKEESSTEESHTVASPRKKVKVSSSSSTAFSSSSPSGRVNTTSSSSQNSNNSSSPVASSPSGTTSTASASSMKKVASSKKSSATKSQGSNAIKQQPQLPDDYVPQVGHRFRMLSSMGVFRSASATTSKTSSKSKKQHTTPVWCFGTVQSVQPLKHNKYQLGIRTDDQEEQQQNESSLESSSYVFPHKDLQAVTVRDDDGSHVLMGTDHVVLQSAASLLVSSELKQGDWVRARYQNGSTWQAGRIARLHMDATTSNTIIQSCDICYQDQDNYYELQVPLTAIQVPELAVSSTTSSPKYDWLMGCQVGTKTVKKVVVSTSSITVHFDNKKGINKEPYHKVVAKLMDQLEQEAMKQNKVCTFPTDSSFTSPSTTTTTTTSTDQTASVSVMTATTNATCSPTASSPSVAAAVKETPDTATTAEDSMPSTQNTNATASDHDEAEPESTSKLKEHGTNTKSNTTKRARREEAPESSETAAGASPTKKRFVASPATTNSTASSLENETSASSSRNKNKPNETEKEEEANEKEKEEEEESNDKNKNNKSAFEAFLDAPLDLASSSLGTWKPRRRSNHQQSYTVTITRPLKPLYGNTFRDALNGPDPHVGAMLLTAMTASHHSMPSESLLEELVDLLTKGPKLSDQRFADLHRVQWALTCMKVILQQPNMLDTVLNVVGADFWRNILQDTMDNLVYCVEGDEERTSETAQRRIVQSLGLQQSATELLLLLLTMGLEHNKNTSLREALPFAADIVEYGTHHAVQLAVTCLARVTVEQHVLFTQEQTTLVQHSHFMRVRQLQRQLGSIVSLLIQLLQEDATVGAYDAKQTAQLVATSVNDVLKQAVVGGGANGKNKLPKQVLDKLRTQIMLCLDHNDDNNNLKLGDKLATEFKITKLWKAINGQLTTTKTTTKTTHRRGSKK